MGYYGYGYQGGVMVSGENHGKCQNCGREMTTSNITSQEWQRISPCGCGKGCYLYSKDETPGFKDSYKGPCCFCGVKGGIK